MTNPIKSLIKTMIRTYTFLISPLLGQNCRFHPTCSAYTMEAVDKHGVLKGLALGIKRISKCHPYCHAQWHDSVPQTIAWAEIIGYKRPNTQKSES